MNPNPDDLLVLLAVSRTGKFTTAAQHLGLNHTTVSRRIAALEKALGGRVLARITGLTGYAGGDYGQVSVAPPGGGPGAVVPAIGLDMA